MKTGVAWLQARAAQTGIAQNSHLFPHLCYTYPVRSRESGSEDAASDSGLESKQREEKNENPSSFCPVCSARLEALKCKLRCRTCGYYMSCSDYY